MNYTQLPLLIIAYLRPNDLSEILNKQIHTNRRIYLFIDRANSVNLTLNKKVIKIADDFKNNSNFRFRISSANLGVDMAVPKAIEWISNFESKFIILEDDCHLTEDGFKFLDTTSKYISSDIVLISASSPWDIEPEYEYQFVSSLSTYPLIHGWCTSADNWKLISQFIGAKVPYIKAYLAMVKNPHRIISISFFLASVIRVKRGSVKAWDSHVALAMLINEKKALIPNITMVTNTGNDLVASNTFKVGSNSGVLRTSSNLKPSSTVSFSKSDTKLTDLKIETSIYFMKKRHFFSPIKAKLFRRV